MNDVLEQIDTLLGEIYYLLDLMDNRQPTSPNHVLAARIRGRCGKVWDLVNLLAQPRPLHAIPLHAMPVFAMQNQDQNQERDTPDRIITLAELERDDGRNGNPAYVAVNGIVYDVTNVAAWAAATHFGMHAGQNLTIEFQACHANQAVILGRLPVVGRLENGSTQGTSTGSTGGGDTGTTE